MHHESKQRAKCVNQDNRISVGTRSRTLEKAFFEFESSFLMPMTYQRPHILVVCGAACRRAFTACFRHFLEVCSCSSTTDPRPRKRKLALATMTVICRNAGQYQGWHDPMRWSKVHRREVSNGKEDGIVIVVMRTATIVANQVEIKQQPRRP